MVCGLKVKTEHAQFREGISYWAAKTLLYMPREVGKRLIFNPISNFNGSVVETAVARVAGFAAVRL